MNMAIGSVLVTGANRGIGLEFNAQSLEDLKKIQGSSVKSQVILIKMDVTVGEEIEAAKRIVEETVGDRGLNLLINNAGLGQSETFPLITPANLELQFKTNTVGPIMVLQTLFPLLEKAASSSETSGKSISRAAAINVSSISGSIQMTQVEFPDDIALTIPGYKISKAALNMGMRVIAANVKDKGILVVNICPGWVKTDMGGKERGEMEPEESIGDMMKTMKKLNESNHGSYIDRLGHQQPF